VNRRDKFIGMRLPGTAKAFTCSSAAIKLNISFLHIRIDKKKPNLAALHNKTKAILRINRNFNTNITLPYTYFDSSFQH
jgi:hypothetical protein